MMSDHRPGHQLLGLREAAIFVGVTAQALLEMAERADVPAVRLPGTTEYHFLEDELRLWMEDSESEGGAP